MEKPWIGGSAHLSREAVQLWARQLPSLGLHFHIFQIRDLIFHVSLPPFWGDHRRQWVGNGEVNEIWEEKYIYQYIIILLYFLPVFFPGLFLCYLAPLIIVYLQFCILLEKDHGGLCKF